MSSPYTRTRSTPRISVNKLGEYLAEHKAARRRAILQAQKKEIRCRVIQYQAARHAIVSSLLRSDGRMESLSQHLQRLREWSPAPDDSDFDVAENRACQEAIRSFMEMTEALDLAELTATRGGNSAPKLAKAGVSVSVRPELVLRGTRRGQAIVGAVKLHFPKSNSLNRTAAEYVGTVLHEYGELHLGPGKCVPRHCYVIDVFTKQVYVAPRATPAAAPMSWRPAARSPHCGIPSPSVRHLSLPADALRNPGQLRSSAGKEGCRQDRVGSPWKRIGGLDGAGRFDAVRGARMPPIACETPAGNSRLRWRR